MTDRLAEIRHVAARLWSGTADPDGGGLLLRGLEYQPLGRTHFDPGVVDGLLRLAQLAVDVADGLAECPDARLRRAAAVLAARGHPLRAAFLDNDNA